MASLSSMLGMALLLVALPTQSAAIRKQVARAHGNRSAGVECPYGHLCSPAPCDVENSNGKPGPECACNDGFVDGITFDGSDFGGSCSEPAPCDVENSNGELGPACACKDGFVNDIAWEGSSARGTCSEPAPCNIENSNGRPGLECACDQYSSGEIEWSGGEASGSCADAERDLASLFHEDHMLVHGDKMFKCCANSQKDKPPKVQDVTLPELPSKKNFGSRTSCPRMFGDRWHSVSNTKPGQCWISFEQLAMTTGIPRAELIERYERAQLA